MLDRQSKGSLHPWAYPPPLRRACIGHCGATSRTPMLCWPEWRANHWLQDNNSLLGCAGRSASMWELAVTSMLSTICLRVVGTKRLSGFLPGRNREYCADLVLCRVRVGDSALSCLIDPGLLRLHQVDRARQCGLRGREAKFRCVRIGRLSPDCLRAGWALAGRGEIGPRAHPPAWCYPVCADHSWCWDFG